MSVAGGEEWGYTGLEGDKPTFRWRESYGATRAEGAGQSMAGGYVAVRSARRKFTVLGVGLLGVLLAIVLVAYLAFAQDDADVASQRNLLLVVALFRHGDRSPIKIYPKDPYQADSWPDGIGALSKKGKLQLFSVGEALRSRYHHFLGSVYRPNMLNVVSSDYDRTVMSAQCLLAGLMPPTEEQRWKADLNWQPIPVHTIPNPEDNLISSKKPCPNYQKELAEAYQSPEIAKINEENQQLYDYLSIHTGQDMHNITAVELLYDTLKIEESNNLKLPEWTKVVYPGKMPFIAKKSLSIFTFTDSMTRFRVGPLLKQISESIKAKMQRILNPDRRMLLYSVHDLTLVGIHRALGFTDLLKPEYGATFLIELRWFKHGESLKIKVLYLDSISLKPIELDVPGCGRECDVKTFLSLIEKYVPSDWKKECELSY